MANKLLPLIALLLTLSTLPLALALAFPTIDLTSNPSTSASTNSDASLLPPSISETSETANYVCEEGCRRPCFDYGYCSSCDYLTGYETMNSGGEGGETGCVRMSLRRGVWDVKGRRASRSKQAKEDTKRDDGEEKICL
ncbi:hypothetical protein DL98DRAFT_638475 [Cadophora sp. DSE1049]|nr:hypothetical protein DL98DRAFT_638475 [Cadophora sp. DSE1049]